MHAEESEIGPSRHPFIFYAGLIFVCAAMLASGAFMYRIPAKQAESGTWVSHTHEVMERLNALELHLNEAEFGSLRQVKRAWKPTPQISFDIDTLQQLTADNPVQKSRIAPLRHLASRGAPGLPKLIESMRAEEKRLLIEREEAWNESLRRTQLFILAFHTLLLAMALLAYLLLSRELARRQLLAAKNRAEADHLVKILHVQQAITTQALEVDGITQLITEQTKASVGAEGSIIEFVDGEEMVYKAGSGIGASHIGIRISRRTSLSGLVVAENRLLRCDDTETDSRVDKVACRTIGVRSMVVAPLAHNGVPFGAVKVLSSRAYAFNDEHCRLLKSLAGFLSARITYANALDGARQDNLSLTAVNAELEDLASTDALTGLKNQRSFRKRLAEEFERGRRYKSIFSLLLIDVDHFKKYNDSFGHVAGDVALRNVGAVLANTARATDFPARYGGEEFAIILPETSGEDAARFAERVRAAIASARWEKRPVTVSVGWSTFVPSMATEMVLVEMADKALYAAKNAGRNCVRSALALAA